MTINRREMLLLAAGLAVAPGAALGQASPEVVQQATQFIQQLAERAIQVLQATAGGLEQRERQLRVLLREGFALEFIGRFVLGRNWRSATPEQQAEYVEAFSEYVLRTYSRRFGGYSGESFTVMGAAPTGSKEDVLVRTRIDRPSGPPILADWRVRQFDGRPQIIDIMVEGVSMAVAQRAEFAAVHKQGGMQGLLQALSARNQKFPAAASS